MTMVRKISLLLTKVIDKYSFLSRNDLKIIALVCMIIDHIGLAFFERGTVLYTVLRLVIGRVAYPLYCVLMVDGFFKTKHRLHHVLTFLFLALLSELPYNLLLSGGSMWFYSAKTNVMVSWLLGFLCLMSYDYIEHHLKSSGFLRSFCLFCTFFAFACISYWLSVDYNYLGICCVTICYFWKSSDRETPLWVLCCVACAILIFGLETWGVLLSILICLLYDESKVCSRSLPVKWFFYLSYPIHLWILALILVFS